MKKLIQNKKGLSEVIATLIMIMLSLIAISMVWITVQSLTKKIQFSPEISCLDIQTKMPLQISSACYNSETKETQFTIERNLENINIENLYFQTNYKWCCGLNCPNCKILDKGTTKTYFLSEETKPKDASVFIENCLVETRTVGDC